MTKVTVHNPTNKTKAVRIAGGHTIVKPGDKAKIDVNFTDEEGDRYVKAGLVFKGPGADDIGEGAKEPESTPEPKNTAAPAPKEPAPAPAPQKAAPAAPAAPKKD